MSNFVNFWSAMFGVVQDFLLSDPIIWFVGLFILLFMVSILYKIFNISK